MSTIAVSRETLARWQKTLAEFPTEVVGKYGPGDVEVPVEVEAGLGAHAISKEIGRLIIGEEEEYPFVEITEAWQIPDCLDCRFYGLPVEAMPCVKCHNTDTDISRSYFQPKGEAHRYDA